MTVTHSFSIRPAADDEMTIVAALFREYGGKLGIDLSYQGFEAEVASLPGDYAPPRGALLLAVGDDDGVPFGCVGVRPLSRQGVCELKRMYVRDDWRGRGVGRALAMAAIGAARSAGYRHVYLDTLNTMTTAIALYESLGFEMIDAYYETPVAGTIFMRRDL